MNTILEIVLALVLIGSTLALGGVLPAAYTAAEFFIFLALLFLLIKQTREGKVDFSLPVWPVIFTLSIIVQISPLPPLWVAHLSPQRLLNAALGNGSGAQQAWTALSVSQHDTLTGLFKFLAYFSAFLLAAYLFDSGKRKSILIKALIFLGCFEAAYGIIQYLTGWNKIFTFTNPFYGDAATGTYINRNHFAGLLELTLPFALALAFYSFQIWSEHRRSTSGPSSAGFQPVFYAVLGVIMVVSLVFSRSRGGILASIFGLVFIALLSQLKIQRKVWALGVFVFLICIVGYGLWIGLDPVLARFELIREPGYLQMEGRISIWKDAVGLVRDNPVCGTGLGTFGLAFRPYQTSLVESYADHAHNDFLEFASETGLLGAALLFLPILYLLARMVISFLSDTRRYRRSVTLGCVGSTLAILVHSITDFNLQIPANALIFAVVLGIGFKAVCIERRGEKPVLGSAAEKSAIETGL